MRLNDLVQPTTYEIFNRVVGLGMLAGTAMITVNSFNQLANPTAHLLSNVLALTTGGVALWSLSQANAEAGVRRDRETMATQAIRDGQYMGMKTAVEQNFQLPSGTVPSGVKLEKRDEVVRLGSNNPIELMLDSDKHILLSAPTRTGKTSVLQAYIRGLYQKYGVGNFDLIILDPKDTYWLGLEEIDEPKIVHYIGSELDTEGLCNIIQHIRDRLDQRINRSQQVLRGRVLNVVEDVLNFDKVKSGKARHLKFKPLFIVFDEYTGSYDDVMTSMDKPVYSRFKNNIKLIASKGAGLGVHLVLVGQSPQITELGFSNNMRSSFDVFCLGSPRGYGSIEKAISDRWLIPSSFQPELKEQWLKIKSQHPKSYLFFTTATNGTFGLTPDLEGIEDTPLYQSIPVPADTNPQTSGVLPYHALPGITPTDTDHNINGYDRGFQAQQGFQPIDDRGVGKDDQKIYGFLGGHTNHTDHTNRPETQSNWAHHATPTNPGDDRRTPTHTDRTLTAHQQTVYNGLSTANQERVSKVLSTPVSVQRELADTFRSKSRTHVVKNVLGVKYMPSGGEWLVVYNLLAEILNDRYPE